MLRFVFENSREVVKIVESDGTLRYASPAFWRHFGDDPEEADGNMNVLDHVHPDDLSHVLQKAEKALGQEGVTSNAAEYRFRHADGSWHHVQSVGATYSTIRTCGACRSPSMTSPRARKPKRL